MLSDPQAAARDFDQALQYTEGVNKAEVYFFRGTIRMGNEDYSGAVEDLEHAVALNPQEYFFFHYLGLAQLFAGQPDGARQTYEQIVPTLDEATRQQVLNDLSALAEDRTDLKPVIDEIIARVKAAKLPKHTP
jgi:tetratricopeptide (TPR) repeat protein